MKIFFSLFLFISSSYKVCAQYNVLNLSLKDTIKLSLENSEDIKINEKSIKKMHYEYIEARSGALPQIKSEIGLNRYIKIPGMPVFDVNPSTGTITGSTIVPLKNDWEMKLGISLEQPIYTFGKVGSALELAREAKKAETLNRDITRKETEYNARTMYATVLFFHRIYEISKSSYENAKKNKKALEKRFGFGRVSRYDNLKISSDVASRLPQVMTSKNNLKQAEQRLKAIIDADTNVNLNLTDRLREKFDTLSQKELEDKMLANDPVLKVLEKNININSLITTINKADYYPTIAGFISYEYSGDSNKLPVEKDEMSSTAVAGIVLKANLFDAGKTRGKYKKAIEDKAISELNLKKTLKAMKLELETSISEYNSLQETLEANRKALDLAKASYETSLSNFSTGKLTLTQLNDAEIMLTGTKFNLEKTIYSLNTLLIKIHKIAAVPMGDRL